MTKDLDYGPGDSSACVLHESAGWDLVIAYGPSVQFTDLGDGENFQRGAKSDNMSWTAWESPTNKARETMLWPILTSSNLGILRRSRAL